MIFFIYRKSLTILKIIEVNKITIRQKMFSILFSFYFICFIFLHKNIEDGSNAIGFGCHKMPPIHYLFHISNFKTQISNPNY
jgi:hypothetical protein